MRSVLEMLLGEVCPLQFSWFNVRKCRHKDIITGVITMLSNYYEVHGNFISAHFLPHVTLAPKEMSPLQKMYTPEIIRNYLERHQDFKQDPCDWSTGPEQNTKRVLQNAALKMFASSLSLDSWWPSKFWSQIGCLGASCPYNFVTSMPEVFLHISVEEFCQKLIEKSFFVPPSAISQGDLKAKSTVKHMLSSTMP